MIPPRTLRRPAGCQTRRVELRLAELVAGLCTVSDLAKGLVDGQGLRSCVFALRLADHLGLDTEERETLFWVGLLRFVGCTATASQMAAALGDEIAVSAAFADADTSNNRDLLRRTVGVVGPRPLRLVSFLRQVPATIAEHEVTSCEVARSVAAGLGLPSDVGTALGQVFERYDGGGHPGLARGTDLHAAVRVWQVAHTADLLSDLAEAGAVAEELRRRSGGALDPEMTERVCSLLHLRPERGTLADLLELEPVPHRCTSLPDELDRVLAVFGLLADAKSPYFHGHSSRVATLAAEAARLAGHPDDDVDRVRRAGLVHDVGKVAVSSRVWDSGRPLSEGEWEQVRLHPYYTQRVLSRVPALADLADLACSHHERSDGSGYHRGTRPAPLTAVLAAADRFVTAGESRPHRQARSTTERRDLLLRDAETGRLPTAAVDAVLAAVGTSAPPRAPSGPLTERELAVLALVAEGLTNQAAARRLGISAKTVNTHLEHVHAKLGVSTRVAAVMEATRAGWLGP
jgi:response regulator RpfG family c-di-GMP phosphodiesterase/DNA-binding CsgD family transcriptional regulator